MSTPLSNRLVDKHAQHGSNWMDDVDHGVYIDELGGACTVSLVFHTWCHFIPQGFYRMPRTRNSKFIMKVGSVDIRWNKQSFHHFPRPMYFVTRMAPKGCPRPLDPEYYLTPKILKPTHGFLSASPCILLGCSLASVQGLPAKVEVVLGRFTILLVAYQGDEQKSLERLWHTYPRPYAERHWGPLVASAVLAVNLLYLASLLAVLHAGQIPTAGHL
jgi:hypothetical protein